MSPRRSSQSGWGMASENRISTKAVVIGCVIVFLFGTLMGWIFRGSSSAETSSGNNAAQSIVDPRLAAIESAPQTLDGAVKAATSYVTGFQAAALLTQAEQQSIFDTLLSPTAAPALTQQLRGTLAEIRNQLVGPPGAERPLTAKLVTSPLTYKSELRAPDQAVISIWYVTVLVDPSGTRVESTWSTTSFELVWTDHWRVQSLTGRSGPTPPLYSPDAQVSSFSDVATVFDGYRSYRSAVQG